MPGVLLLRKVTLPGSGTLSLGYLVAGRSGVFRQAQRWLDPDDDAAQTTCASSADRSMTDGACCGAPQTPLLCSWNPLRKNRSAASVRLMDSLDAGDYEDTDAEKGKLHSGPEQALGHHHAGSQLLRPDVLTQQAATVQSQLGGNPSPNRGLNGLAVHSSAPGG